MSTGPGRAAIYARISSDAADEKAGVTRQTTECEQLAERHGLDVTEVYLDNDVSAYSGKVRPEFERMLADAQAGQFDHLLVWASDRLYRRMVDLLRITSDLAPHVRIHAVHGGDVDLESAEGILRAQMLGSIAEYESRHKSDRIRAQITQRTNAGTMTASIRPFGWRWADPCPGGDDCRHRTTCTPGQRARIGSRSGLVLHPIEAPVIAEAYRKIKDGATIPAVWRQVVADGVPIGDPRVLRGVLLHVRNKGKVAHKGTVVTDAANGLALIDEDTFDTVERILRDPSRRTTPGRPAGTFLGGGLLRCGRCGGTMSASSKDRAPIYMCSQGRHLSRRRSLLDDRVLALVRDVLLGLEARGLLTMTPADDEEGARMREEVAEVEGRREELADLVSTGAMTPADYARAATRITAQLDDLTARLTRRSRRPALGALAASAGGVGAAWDALLVTAGTGDVDGLRAVLREVLVSVTVTPDGGVDLVWRGWVPADPPTRMAGKPAGMARDERRVRVAELHGEGWSQSRIGARLGVARKTVGSDLKALGLAS